MTPAQQPNQEGASGAIDVQQHYVPPSLLEALSELRPGQVDRLSTGTTDLSPRIADMDEAGVELALLSISELGRYQTDQRDEDAELAKRYNDELLEAARAFPGRFAASITLPFPHPEECLDELQRVKDEPLVRGVIAFAATEHYTLDDPALDPVYAAIAEAGLPLFLHPAFDQLPTLPLLSEWMLNAGIAPMVETSATAARMMLSGVLDRAPALVMVIPHLGGLLPYLAQRLVDQSGTGDAEHDVLHYLRHRCLLDSCSYHRPALDCAVATVSAERIMLGSDFPFRGPVQRATADIEGSELDEADRAAILRGNAVRLGLCG